MPVDARPNAIFLMGSTATGKTALACALSERFPLDLISVDSAMVYRGLDIGAAKPDPATLARYPHGLVDIRDPAEPYSAAEFRTDAQALMRDIGRKGRVPLLVGGTGLYFRALQHGLSELPRADAALRARLGQAGDREGWPAMHERLAALDPDAARQIDPNDPQRIQRALEVIELTGQRISVLKKVPTPAIFPWRVLKLGLVPEDRTTLHARVARRLDAMLAAGFLREAAQLFARQDLHEDLPAMRAVGYRQAGQYLRGECNERDFRDRAIFATRQLAKRQITWLRGDPALRAFDPWHGNVHEQMAAAVALFLGDEAE